MQLPIMFDEKREHIYSVNIFKFSSSGDIQYKTYKLQRCDYFWYFTGTRYIQNILVY